MKLLIAIAITCIISSCCFHAQCDGPYGLPCSGPLTTFLEREFLLFDTSTQYGFKKDSVKFLILYLSTENFTQTDTQLVETFLTSKGFPCLRYKIDVNTFKYLRVGLQNGSNSWLFSDFIANLEEGQVPQGDCCRDCVTKFHSVKLDSVLYNQDQFPILVNR